jgi:DNA polymerase-3 subunit delta
MVNMKNDRSKKESMKLESLEPCYLYISSSDSMLDERIDNIEGFLKGKINIDTDFKVFNGAEEIDEEEFNNYISTPSLFSSKKIAVIKYINKVSTSLRKKIMESISINNKKNYDIVFILTSLKQKLNQGLIDLIKKTGTVKQLRAPGGVELKSWLDKKSRSDGIAFTGPAASLLIENVNLDLNLLKKEYEKLFNYMASETKKVIDEDTVRFLVSRVYSMKIFDLVDCLGRRDKRGSLEALKTLLDENQSMIGLVTLVYRMFKCFLYIKSASGRQTITDYIKSSMKVPPYFVGKLVSKYIKWSSNFTESEIIKVFRLLNEYDISFRSNSGQDDNLVKRLVLEIVEIST